MLSFGVEVFIGVALLFFALAKFNARPGFNAIALGIVLAMTPAISSHLPGHGDIRDAATVLMFLVSASLGTALGGGLKPREGEEHDHDHGAFHHDDD